MKADNTEKARAFAAELADLMAKHGIWGVGADIYGDTHGIRVSASIIIDGWSYVVSPMNDYVDVNSLREYAERP